MKRLPRIKTKCTECNKTFWLKPYLARKPVKFGRFCSMACKSKYIARHNPASQLRRINVRCTECGKEMQMQPYRVLDKNFCSNSCRGKYGTRVRWEGNRKVKTVKCANCGTPKELREWDYRLKTERGQEQFFCNRACFAQWKAANWQLENNPAWKGGWTPHGKGWDIICQRVRKEQNYKCADCGKSEKQIGQALDVHHLIPARLFKRKADGSFRTNLIGLCHICHMRRERAIEML